MRVLFVCTGNICRSPAAHAVLEQKLRIAGDWATTITVDSVGLGNWHEGELPDPRARAAGKRRGYDLNHPARGIRLSDFSTHTWIIALDTGHLQKLQQMRPPTFPAAQITLLRSYHQDSELSVADPYYGPESGFEEMFDVIESAIPGLIHALKGSTQ